MIRVDIYANCHPNDSVTIWRAFSFAPKMTARSQRGPEAAALLVADKIGKARGLHVDEVREVAVRGRAHDRRYIATMSEP